MKYAPIILHNNHQLQSIYVLITELSLAERSFNFVKFVKVVMKVC